MEVERVGAPVEARERPAREAAATDATARATSAADPVEDGEDAASRVEIEQWRALARERRAIEVPLIYPVQFGADKIDKLVVRPLSGRELKLFPVDPRLQRFEHYLAALTFLTNQPDQVVEAVAPADLSRLMAVVTLFWRASRRTGAAR